MSPTYAALDLGTNNCRLLAARPLGERFEVVDCFSRIVRLGEGLSESGRLQPAAMDRAVAALGVCRDRIRRAGATRVRAVATQACRAADNGADFLERVRAETGLELEVITPEAEARLSVDSCRDLFDRSFDAVLVLDVGGGSTELSWLDLRRIGPDGRPRLVAWRSVPIGVVTLAERAPERREGQGGWWRALVELALAELSAGPGDPALSATFAAGRGCLIGASGAITSLAGVHLDLPRYRRERVDGLWMDRAECDAVVARTLGMTMAERAAHPCIGPDRADLVLAGAAILEAVLRLWPSPRLRVADRGLREGLLLNMMAEDRLRRAPQAVR